VRDAVFFLRKDVSTTAAGCLQDKDRCCLLDEKRAELHSCSMRTGKLSIAAEVRSLRCHRDIQPLLAVAPPIYISRATSASVAYGAKGGPFWARLP